MEATMSCSRNEGILNPLELASIGTSVLRLVRACVEVTKISGTLKQCFFLKDPVECGALWRLEGVLTTKAGGYLTT